MRCPKPVVWGWWRSHGGNELSSSERSALKWFPWFPRWRVRRGFRGAQEAANHTKARSLRFRKLCR